jgi:hypothetical protein
MAIANDILQYVSDTFSFLVSNGLTIKAVYTKVTEGTYNPTLDTTVDSEKNIAINAVRDTFDAKETDGIRIFVTDAKLIFEQKELGVPVSQGDYVTVDGDKWDIIDFNADPVNAIWMLHIRRSK